MNGEAKFFAACAYVLAAGLCAFVAIQVTGFVADRIATMGGG